MAITLKKMITREQTQRGQQTDEAIGLMSSRDAAAWLDISERTLWTLTNSRELARLKVGGSVKYDIADLRAYVSRQKAAQ